MENVGIVEAWKLKSYISTSNSVKASIDLFNDGQGDKSERVDHGGDYQRAKYISYEC